MSAIEAQQNPYIFIIIIIAAIISLIFSFINIYMNFRQKQYKNVEKKNTLKKTLTEISKHIFLTENEITLLEELCDTNEVIDLKKYVKNNNYKNAIEAFFNILIEKIYSNYAMTVVDEKVEILFNIRQKIEILYTQYSVISNTNEIEKGQILNLIDGKNNQYETKVLENNKKYLSLTLPKNIFNEVINLKKGSKITLIFEEKNAVAYILQSKIYKVFDNHFTIYHATNIQILHRRTAKRIKFDYQCKYNAVKIFSVNGKKGVNIEYKNLDKTFDGKLWDISSDGCCLISNFPMKENQYIHISTKIDGKNEDNIIGIIIKSVKDYSKDFDTFRVHIRFVQISKKSRNKIFSKIYMNNL
ncbi:MAG: PilZ domain-containing protein [Treponema sp.]|nr:PilZ domain-containing protein [Treponema sp.]